MTLRTIAGLPPRYQPVFCLLMTGKTNRQIAEELCLAVHTVENYVSGILAYFGCASRAELIARYYLGWSER